VIANGSIVMENRRFPWDTGPAFADAREQARRLGLSPAAVFSTIRALS
jgi:hypothetical protein